MRKRELVDIVFTELGKRFGDATTELQYKTPFQLLICVMLSAQTTDKRVNMITPALFKKYPDAETMSKATPEEILPFIKTVNYANGKSRYLAGTARMLVERNSKFGILNSKGNTELNPHSDKSGSSSASADKFTKEPSIAKNIEHRKSNIEYLNMIPNTIEELMNLPGVGEKTAKVVLHTLFGHNVIAVDTHVHRVANRLGIVKTSLPLQTSKQLEKIVPEKYKSFAHHGLIFFGRYTCTAIKPHCSTCPFQKICPYFAKVISKNRKHQ